MPITITGTRPMRIKSETTAGTAWESVTVPEWAREVEVQNPTATGGGGGANAYVGTEQTSGARTAATDHEVELVAGASVRIVLERGTSPARNRTIGVCTPGGAAKLNFIVRD
jgi:hypothetical protein